jgi:MSHA biogenesis protein MshG
MPEFQYTARDAKGQPITGRRNAISAEDLAQQLLSESITPIEITRPLKKEAVAQKNIWFKLKFRKQKIPQEDMQMMCRQMYTILKAGVPIGMGVARIAETTRDKYLAQTLHKIIINLNQGRTLHQSLNQFPDIFSQFFVNLVNVGETTGKLDQVFLYLAEYIELEVDTKKKIKSALRYPILVLVAGVIALLVINAFVIPAFATLFKSFQGALPLPTRILIASSDFLLGYWYILLALIVAGFLSARSYIKTPGGKLKWAKLQLKLPIIGWIIHRIILARFTQLYALALRAGISAVEGIEMVGASTGNAYIAQKVGVIASLVARGNSIANSISQTQLFPPLVIQMIALGEETGTIENLLDDVSEFYQREVDYDLERLGDAIEPIMLVLMAGMVLILALGVFLPMWDIASQIKRV